MTIKRGVPYHKSAFCKSCGKLTFGSYCDEHICYQCAEMFESAQNHHDLGQASSYLFRHPDLLAELTPSERGEIARYLRSDQC